ncbi:DUF554 domain-containing protein [Azorhizobium doebereinerae]|uniref:DUF554 domain-containing protein n=1 Tax=Azorhizobium doebereinerae TaxID=281091 RepID=UPI0003FC5661|nr:DUF554 domain-containing protein [Azorhizobium doebereinerae]
MIGSVINASAVLIGGVVGAALGTRLPERLRTAMPMTFGAASMAMGVVLIVRVETIGVMVISLLLGAILGELIYLERGIGAVAEALNSLLARYLPKPKDLSNEAFLEKYVAITVLFCASGTGIFGAMQEGMTGDPSILIAKSSLDLLTAGIFATSLGFAVAAICIPQIIVLLGLTYGAIFIVPIMTTAMNHNFSAVGGALMLATGFRICGIKSFPVANMLPALLFAMPVTALWGYIF